MGQIVLVVHPLKRFLVWKVPKDQTIHGTNTKHICPIYASHFSIMPITHFQARHRLAGVEEKFHLLHDLAEKGALQLKCDVLSLEKHVQKEKEEFQVIYHIQLYCL